MIKINKNRTKITINLEEKYIKKFEDMTSMSKIFENTMGAMAKDMTKGDDEALDKMFEHGKEDLINTLSALQALAKVIQRHKEKEWH